MFQILYPLGLLAALGILIPVIIHLWNIRSGKTLKIGSVFLLGTPTNQRSRSFRVQDWPLLLLRVLLLLLAALLLAEPVYFRTTETTGKAGWILLEKAQFRKIWRQQHKQLDALLKAGYEVHDLAVGFPKIDIKDSLTVFSAPSGTKLPYYALLRQLNHLHPAGTNIRIFAENQRQLFSGEKPKTHLNVQWSFFAKDTTQLHWPVAAYQLQSGSIRTLEAQSSDKGIYYKTSEINQDIKQEFPVDTTTILVQLYAPEKSVDGEFVRAAISAISQYTERKIRLKDIKTINAVSNNASVVFWLSDKRLTGSQVSTLPKGIRLFTYEGNKVEKFRSVVHDLRGAALQDVRLFKKTSPISMPGSGVWVDGTGSPLLAVNPNADLEHYLFYSRFRPDWTDMVWSEQMVYFLLPVILPESAANEAFRDAGKLPVSRVEVTDEQKVVPHSRVKSKIVAEDLSPWLWYGLLLVFFVERWITYNKRKVGL